MSLNDVYQPVWNKFLPVIYMKLKMVQRKQEPEFLVMDLVDFEKASHRKNSNYQFRLEMKEGRLQKSKTVSSVGLDFARAMKADEPVFNIIKSGHYVFSLNNRCILTISPVLADPFIPEKVEVPVENEPVPEKGGNE